MLSPMTAVTTAAAVHSSTWAWKCSAVGSGFPVRCRHG